MLQNTFYGAIDMGQNFLSFIPSIRGGPPPAAVIRPRSTIKKKSTSGNQKSSHVQINQDFDV